MIMEMAEAYNDARKQLKDDQTKTRKAKTDIGKAAKRLKSIADDDNGIVQDLEADTVKFLQQMHKEIMTLIEADTA